MAMNVYNDAFPGDQPAAKPVKRAKAAAAKPAESTVPPEVRAAVEKVQEVLEPSKPPKAKEQPARKLNLHQRLNAAQLEVDYVQKEKRQGMRYSIVSHDAVTAKVRPVLVKYGVLYYPVRCARTQVGNRTELDMTVRFVSIDDRSDYIDVGTAGYGIDESDKGPGKAISYAVKYALLKALGMETGDDPDLEQDTKFDASKPAVQAGPGPKSITGSIEQATVEKANKVFQSEDDKDYINGLVLRMARITTKEDLAKLHTDSSDKRIAIRDRDPETFQIYLDAMKQRASEIDAASQAR